MLHLVGLGLADETDITVRGLEIVKKAERVYLEAYTAILLVDKAKLVSISPNLLAIWITIRIRWPLFTFDALLLFELQTYPLNRKHFTAVKSLKQTAN